MLKEAGLSAYNHNLDTSPEHYPNVITTRSYEDRLQTIANVRDAGIQVCCGGILGLGEEENDRVIEKFVGEHTEAHVQPLQLPLGTATRFGWQMLPSEPTTDGFFYALIRKAQSS